jgi:hypothetical protein
MATTLEKLILAFICGAALGTTGCVRSCKDVPSRPSAGVEPSRPPEGVEEEPAGKDLPPVKEHEESGEVGVYGPPSQ